MDMALSSQLRFFSLPNTTTTPQLFPTANCKPYPALRSRNVKPLRCAATAIHQTPDIELEHHKYNLLKAIQDTQRGLVTNADQRSHIEESMVTVEGYSVGAPIDLVKLDGTWRLHYTSAPDVLILFESAARFPFFQVGPIFQKFECWEQSNGGVVLNVVQWSIPTLLEEETGATLLVSANFSVISPRNIYLKFEELTEGTFVQPPYLIITFQNIKISQELQALIAPAILPRTFLNLQILQFIRSFKARFSVSSDPSRRSVGGLYYLSYLDDNMLLGRAVGGGGVFVFTRAQPFHS